MSKKETPLTRKYWQEIGGTLIEEFLMVPKGKNNGARLIDAIIIPNEETKILNQKEINLKGKDIIAVQTKANRLGMYLMGQTLFSEQLLKKYHNPKSIVSVALCTKDDSVLRPLLEKYQNIKVIIINTDS
ncbi:MAG: hypothetical protein ACMXX9_02890 [Candidatus Woesearchaeota archaeon]